MEQGLCQAMMNITKRLYLIGFCQHKAQGSDINQSAFGANMGSVGRYVTFFVSLEAIAQARRWRPLIVVVQERRLSNASNGAMNFS